MDSPSSSCCGALWNPDERVKKRWPPSSSSFDPVLPHHDVVPPSPRDDGATVSLRSPARSDLPLHLPRHFQRCPPSPPHSPSSERCPRASPRCSAVRTTPYEQGRSQVGTGTRFERRVGQWSQDGHPHGVLQGRLRWYVPPSPLYTCQFLNAVMDCRLHSRGIEPDDTLYATFSPREIVDLSRYPPPPSSRHVPRARSRQLGRVGSRFFRRGNQECGWLDGMGRRGTWGCYRLGGTQGQLTVCTNCGFRAD